MDLENIASQSTISLNLTQIFVKLPQKITPNSMSGHRKAMRYALEITNFPTTPMEHKGQYV